VYVLALVDRCAEPVVMSGRRVEFVDLGPVCAAVERPGEDPAASEDALRRQHAIVCRLGDRFEALLPARFGTVVDIGELRRIVALRAEAIGRALELVRGRVQMTVRIAGALLEPAADSAIRAAASGTEYLRARRAAATARVPAAVLARIESAVGRFVAASRADDSGARGVAVYHLVGRDHAEPYRAAMSELPPPAGGLTIRVSGPWPPFAFVPELW